MSMTIQENATISIDANKLCSIILGVLEDECSDSYAAALALSDIEARHICGRVLHLCREDLSQ